MPAKLVIDDLSVLNIPELAIPLKEPFSFNLPICKPKFFDLFEKSIIMPWLFEDSESNGSIEEFFPKDVMMPMLP